jgi:hypothetical protein
VRVCMCVRACVHVASLPHYILAKREPWQVVDSRRSAALRHLLGEAALDNGGSTGLTVELRILAHGDADAAALQVMCSYSAAMQGADLECMTCKLSILRAHRLQGTPLAAAFNRNERVTFMSKPSAQLNLTCTRAKWSSTGSTISHSLLLLLLGRALLATRCSTPPAWRTQDSQPL